jgi:phosphoglycolate phosphatase-like HAD superfamily hydrolase
MADKKNINFVITDLDDTIWDWLTMWHSSFEPYLRRISDDCNIDIDELKRDFKQLHQKYKTSEASFIYHDLRTLTQEQKDKFESPVGNRRSALHEYYSLKKKNLSLYEGVLDTLTEIKRNGALVVGFTESNAFFTKYRIKHLQLDGLFDCIYAPIDFDVPESVYRHYSEETWEPEKTHFRYLANETKKPAPEILEIILRDFKAVKKNTIYIGDKLDKDVNMANDASITSIYAKYGHKIGSDQYNLLKEVTHWTQSDVQRELEFKESHKQTPIATYTINKSFGELISWFNFFEFPTKNKFNLSSESVIEIWKKIIDVQQHFNDLALRIRNIAITMFTFIIGGIGYAEKEKLALKFECFDIPYSTFLSAMGLLIMFAFFYMDRAWYHKLLVGSVKQGLDLEKKWGTLIPEIRLTKAIGDESPHRWFFNKRIHSKEKFYIFYGLLSVPLLLIGIITFIVRNLGN